MAQRRPAKIALVMGGGGARGAYEAGVLAHLFERVLPELPPGFEFDIVSGTSVGAIHAAYVAASAHEPPQQRAEALCAVWNEMRLPEMVRVSPLDVARVPLRALGLARQRREPRAAAGSRVLGGLVDLSGLERVVGERVPWSALPGNLASGRPGVLCVTCTEVRSGLATVFMDGPLADPAPWSFDPASQARRVAIEVGHVRASAAIPFLFPAVQLGNRYFVDGGLRMSTPLSPAVRLGADRIVVVSLSRARQSSDDAPAYAEEVIAQPTFLLGKLLDALMLDPLDYELSRLGTINAWIAQGRRAFGEEFLERINSAVEQERGVGYRPIDVLTLRPSEDLGVIAGRCFQREKGRSLRGTAALLARAATRGVPGEDAELFSYLFFDRCYTRELLDLGQKDAQAAHGQLLSILRGEAH